MSVRLQHKLPSSTVRARRERAHAKHVANVAALDAFLTAKSPPVIPTVAPVDPHAASFKFEDWPYDAHPDVWRDMSFVLDQNVDEFMVHVRDKFKELYLHPIRVESSLKEWFADVQRGKYDDIHDPEVSVRYAVSWFDAWWDRRSRRNRRYYDALQSWAKSLSFEQRAALKWWTRHGDSIMNQIATLPFIARDASSSSSSWVQVQQALANAEREFAKRVEYSDTTRQLMDAFQVQAWADNPRLYTGSKWGWAQEQIDSLSHLVHAALFNLRSALRKAPPTPTKVTLFRGVRIPWELANDLAQSHDRVIVSTAPQAFSRSPVVPLRFNPTVMFMLTVPPHYPLGDLQFSHLTKYDKSSEFEILLPQGTLFQITRAYKPSKRAFATFRIIDEDEGIREYSTRFIRQPIIVMRLVTPVDVQTTIERPLNVNNPYFLTAHHRVPFRSQSGQPHRETRHRYERMPFQGNLRHKRQKRTLSAIQYI